MFADGFLSDHIFEILGLLVTIVGIILVLRQIRESTVSSQLSGFLELASQFVGIASSIEFVDALSTSDDWKSLDAKEAFNYLTEDEEIRPKYKEVGAFYETLSALVRRGALDHQLSIDAYGSLLSQRWSTLEKAISVHRKVLGNTTLYEQWEWAAHNFKK